jgi:hypothetical protein
LVINNLECKLREHFYVAECNPVIQIKKLGDGKENKLDTRGGTPNRRSVKRFRSPGLHDTASPGEYSCEVSKHFKRSRKECVVPNGR